MPQPGVPGKELTCQLWAITCHLVQEVDQATGGLSAQRKHYKKAETARKQRKADCSEMALLSQWQVLLTVRAPGSWNCFPKFSPAGCRVRAYRE